MEFHLSDFCSSENNPQHYMTCYRPRYFVPSSSLWQRRPSPLISCPPLVNNPLVSINESIWHTIFTCNELTMHRNQAMSLWFCGSTINILAHEGMDDMGEEESHLFLSVKWFTECLVFILFSFSFIPHLFPHFATGQKKVYVTKTRLKWRSRNNVSS